jgi:hypothetical protein
VDRAFRRVASSFTDGKLAFPSPFHRRNLGNRIVEPKFASSVLSRSATVSMCPIPLPDQTTQTAICSDFTGATGLEPATSGVTGRSRRLRAERE